MESIIQQLQHIDTIKKMLKKVSSDLDGLEVEIMENKYKIAKKNGFCEIMLNKYYDCHFMESYFCKCHDCYHDKCPVPDDKKKYISIDPLIPMFNRKKPQIYFHGMKPTIANKIKDFSGFGKKLTKDYGNDYLFFVYTNGKIKQKKTHRKIKIWDYKFNPCDNCEEIVISKKGKHKHIFKCGGHTNKA